MRKATKSLLFAALRKDHDIAKLKTQKEELQSQLDEASLDVFFARRYRKHEKGWIMSVAVFSRKKKGGFVVCQDGQKNHRSSTWIKHLASKSLMLRTMDFLLRCENFSGIRRTWNRRPWEKSFGESAQVNIETYLLNVWTYWTFGIFKLVLWWDNPSGINRHEKSWLVVGLIQQLEFLTTWMSCEATLSYRSLCLFSMDQFNCWFCWVFMYILV